MNKVYHRDCNLQESSHFELIRSYSHGHNFIELKRTVELGSEK